MAVAKINESLEEEGFSDGRVSQSDIVNAIDALQGLLDEMETLDVDEITASGTTSGLGRFYAAFPRGFIDLDNTYQYLPGEQDEEEEEYDESLQEGSSTEDPRDEIKRKYDIADTVMFEVLQGYDPYADVDVTIQDDNCTVEVVGNEADATTIKRMARKAAKSLEKFSDSSVEITPKSDRFTATFTLSH